MPHHELVAIENEESELAPWNLMEKDFEGKDRLAKELLPKILITDPAVQAIKEMTEAEDDTLLAGWLTNRVMKVHRYSRSAGTSIAYRLVVERA